VNPPHLPPVKVIRSQVLHLPSALLPFPLPSFLDPASPVSYNYYILDTFSGHLFCRRKKLGKKFEEY
jgi:hypothetical protein